MIEKMLNIPYVSRYASGEGGQRLDCGACCVAMLLDAMAEPTSVQDIVAASETNPQERCHLSPKAILRSAQAHKLTLFQDKGYTFNHIKRLIDDGQAPVAILKYSEIPDRQDQRCTGRHYVLVVGYDDTEGLVYLNDPHYAEAAAGYRRAYAYQIFLDAWHGFECSLLVPVPVPPPPALSEIAVSFALPPTTGDVWVIAPLGLRLRARPEVNAESVVEYGVPFGDHLATLGPEIAPGANGYAWQQVLTDQGITAWVAAGKGGDRYLSATQPSSSRTVYVLDTQPVRQAGGLGLRATRDVNAEPTERAAIGDALVAYQRVTETDGSIWLWVKSPKESFGWVREAADGVTLISDIRPTSHTTSAVIDGFLRTQPDVLQLPLATAKPLHAPAGASWNMKVVATIWNQYGGLIEPLASQLGTDPAVAIAVVAAESGGRGAGPDGRMIIRFENHIFWSYWGKYHPDVFNAYFQLENNQYGHAYRPSPDAPWRKFHGDQAEEWNVLGVAQSLDDRAAKLSISMGLAQIMGFNYATIGYPNVQAMFDALKADLRMQLLGLFDYAKQRGAVPAMQSQDFVRFALLYNGKGQEADYSAIIQRYYDAFQELKARQG